MKTKEIDISKYWDEPAKITIRRLGFGEQNELLDKYTNVIVKGKNVDAQPLYGKLRTETVLKCIVDAPFPITEEYINTELPADLGEYIFDQIDQFGSLNAEKKESSEVAGKT